MCFFLSCERYKEESKLNLGKVSDLNGKFEINLPVNWKKEFITTEFSSGIISSDTTGELRDAIILNINWDKGSVYINSKIKRTIDSLNATVGLTTKFRKSGKIGDYMADFNFSCGYDSIKKIQLNKYMYILKDDSINGYILMTAAIYGDSVTKKDSELIAEIVKTLKMNKG